MKKMLSRALTALAVVAPLLVFAYASPGKPLGLVNDFAQVLTAEQEAVLEQTLKQNEQTTGNEISVVTVKNLGGDTVENFAVKLFEEWGIGKKDKDNGALLLVAIDDRQMRIEVGYGLESYLTDAQSGQIIRNVIAPKFKQGDYSGGITDGVKQIIAATKGESVALPDIASNFSAKNIFDFGLFSLWFGYFVITISGSLLARSKSWWAGGIVGGVIGLFLMLFVTLIHGLIAIAVLVPIGLLFDFLVSKEYAESKLAGRKPHWWAGGGGFSGGGFGGGGFGGFGGGRSGGGGASGGW